METQTRATLDAAVELAKANGWDWTVGKGDRSTIPLECRRGDERISLTAWLLGNVHCAHGELATGIYSRSSISNRGWNSNIPLWELTEWFQTKPASEYDNNSGFDLVVADGDPVQEHWETASNYTLKKLTPGRYPIELQTLGWHRVTDPQAVGEGRPYWGRVRVPATDIREHYVNRVFTASSAHDNELNRPSSYHWSCYSYQLPLPGNGKPGSPGQLFSIVPQET